MAETEQQAHPQRPRWQLNSVSSIGPVNYGSAAADVTTRGQRLPSIIHSRSTTNLFGIGKARPRGHSFSRDDENPDLPDDLAQLTRRSTIFDLPSDEHDDEHARRAVHGAEVLMTPQMRSMRLIGYTNPRYRWQQYYKTEDQLKAMSKKLRQYYERTNILIAHYLYIDRLLDSSLPFNLIQEYQQGDVRQMDDDLSAIPEESPTPISEPPTPSGSTSATPRLLPQSKDSSENDLQQYTKVKRTPKDMYKLPDEQSPLMSRPPEPGSTPSLDEEELPEVPMEEDEDVDSGSPVVTVAIYINMVANIILLAGKIAVIVLTDSLSVLASLVDAALDFLSTAIVWITTYLIQRQDQYAYPVGRRRLEPVGVLVFSVIMITSFFQVGLECINRLASDNHSIVQLTVPAIGIMVGTVVIKGFCYFWCRLVKNSSVQALAQDALTDIVFNTFSIIFPLVGYAAKIWWLDALGGLVLSMYVIFNWSTSATEHIRNLSGAAATADQRNVLLYLTMRFAKTIRYIQGLQAYHAGDKLNCEVDIVLDENMNLRDSHDLSESLQYVLESVPTVDRAFVHCDYRRVNLPSHMNQQA